MAHKMQFFFVAMIIVSMLNCKSVVASETKPGHDISVNTTDNLNVPDIARAMLDAAAATEDIEKVKAVAEAAGMVFIDNKNDIDLYKDRIVALLTPP